jgi:hypothetical protein
MVTIPANALVMLVVGDIDGNGFVEVRYHCPCLDLKGRDRREAAEETILLYRGCVTSRM